MTFDPLCCSICVQQNHVNQGFLSLVDPDLCSDPLSHLCFPSQIKAMDNGRPQKSSTARLHIEWIRRPQAAPPLRFDQPLYNFTVMESDKVSEIVGVVSLQQSSTTVWFDITGGRTLQEWWWGGGS